MIDDADFGQSTLKLLAYQALKAYSTDALHKLLDDPDVVVRSAVARELQIRGNESTFDVLQRLANDARDFVREISAFTLGQLGTPNFPFRVPTIPMLCKLANDESEDVRAAALAALGHLSAHEAMSTIIRGTRDASAVVRACAAGALGRTGASDESLMALRQLLDDPNDDVRDWAALSFELLSDSQVP
jgi:HEAT repeat protein